MGKRGPRRTPTKTLKRAGSHRGVSREKTEAKVNPAIPSCPAWVEGEGCREWRRVTKHLAAAGLLAHIDRGILAVYCQAYHEYQAAVKDVRKHGISTVSATGYECQRPVVAVMHKAREMMIKAGARFGMSPSDRAGLDAVNPEKDIDEFSAYQAERSKQTKRAKRG